MHPSELDILFSPISKLPGITERSVPLLSKLLGRGEAQKREARILDLLFHLPTFYLDRTLLTSVRDVTEESVLTLRLLVQEHRPPEPYSDRPYRILCRDATESITLVFFQAKSYWLSKLLPEGSVRFVTGKVMRYRGAVQMAHPKSIQTEAEFEKERRISPVYPQAAGVSSKFLEKLIPKALELLPSPLGEEEKAVDSPSDLSEMSLLWPRFRRSLQSVHCPETMEECRSCIGGPRSFLAFCEIFTNQFALALLRRKHKEGRGCSYAARGQLTEALRKALPFALTSGQERVLQEIEKDLKAPRRMLRLLQGDVGSGKTIVALMAIATVVESGAQAALMAPTEVLAQQHFEKLHPLCEKIGLQTALLFGKMPAKKRRACLKGIEAGDIDLVIGTHALFQDSVQFHRLGLAVIDEQHRFGVLQRLSLSEKGLHTDVLGMSATPIPRSLVLTRHGDMDLSILKEKPMGRQKIDTRVLSLARLEELIERIAHALQRGQKLYWICPLVTESERVDLAACTERFHFLQTCLSFPVSLVHGKMRKEEKDAAVQAFRTGESKILVATTVVEVGVDVPDATLIVIEHAERFGLSQLHQLRGRVGRGSEKSVCILLYKPPLDPKALARLEVVRRTDDGFLIAQEDLRHRGTGDVLGTRQSGVPLFRLAQIPEHISLIPEAHRQAQILLKEDPGLQTPNSCAALSFLRMFDVETAAFFL